MQGGRGNIAYFLLSNGTIVGVSVAARFSNNNSIAVLVPERMGVSLHLYVKWMAY